jgi:hypothetical protein
VQTRVVATVGDEVDGGSVLDLATAVDDDVASSR